MKCEDDLRQLLRRYIDSGNRDYDRAAEDVAVEMFRVFHTAHRVWLIEQVDEDFATDVLRSFVDLTFGLSLNPFWQANSAHLQPILANTMSSWLLWPQYAREALNPDPGMNEEQLADVRLKSVVVHSAIVELISAVVRLANRNYFDIARKLRDELTAFKERHLLQP